MTAEKTLSIHDALKIGIQHYENNELQQAEAVYNAVLKVQPNNPDALNLLGILALKVNKLDIAEKLITKSLSLDPNNICALFHLGRVKEAMKKYDEAIQAYNNTIEKDPNYASAYNNVGNIYNDLGNYTESIKFFEEALSIEPDNADTLINFGNALRNYNDTIKAITIYKKALAISPRNYGALIGMGNVLCEVGQDDNAVGSFKEAVKLAPHIMSGHLGLGNAFKNLQRFDEAISSYECALEISPNNPGILNNIGFSLFLDGKTEESIEFYNKARQIDPDYIGTYCNLGASQAILGQLDNAISNHKTSISLLLKKLGAPKDIIVNRKSMPGACAHEAFLDFCDVMDKNNLEFFLCFGTLLGFIRESDFLSFDKDIDLGVDENISLENLLTTFSKSEKFAIYQEHKLPEDPLVVSLDHINGTGFDIFIHKKKDHKLLAGLHNPTENLYWEFSEFSLIEKNFLGKKVLIPKNHDLYLEEIYGDWKTPDPFFDSIISGQNLTKKGNRLALCYALNRIYDNLEKGDYYKALKLCKQTITVLPHDDLLHEVKAFLG